MEHCGKKDRMSEKKKERTNFDVQLQVIAGCRKWLERLSDQAQRVRVLEFLNEGIQSERTEGTGI